MFGLYMIHRDSVFIPHHLGKIDVGYDGQDFYIIKGEESNYKVSMYDLSKDLRGISAEKLATYMAFSYLAIKTLGNDYGITLKHRGMGGGRVGAAMEYGVEKVLWAAGLIVSTGADFATAVDVVVRSGQPLVHIVPQPPTLQDWFQQMPQQKRTDSSRYYNSSEQP